MMAVKHDNVLDLRRVVQAAQFAGTQMLLLELELCAGGELFDYIIFGGAFPEPIAKHYFKQLMSAMIACHEKGVYHRDLKPENILLTGEPYYALKVADFGLAAVPSHAQPSSRRGRQQGADAAHGLRDQGVPGARGAQRAAGADAGVRGRQGGRVERRGGALHHAPGEPAV